MLTSRQDLLLQNMTAVKQYSTIPQQRRCQENGAGAKL